MSEPALRADVISALRDAKGVSITELADGSLEVAAVGEPIRRFQFRSTVTRKLLWRLVKWYNIPIAAFFKSFRVMPQSDASGE